MWIIYDILWKIRCTWWVHVVYLNYPIQQWNWSNNSLNDNNDINWRKCHLICKSKASPSRMHCRWVCMLMQMICPIHWHLCYQFASSWHFLVVIGRVAKVVSIWEKWKKIEIESIKWIEECYCELLTLKNDPIKQAADSVQNNASFPTDFDKSGTGNWGLVKMHTFVLCKMPVVIKIIVRKLLFFPFASCLFTIFSYVKEW